MSPKAGSFKILVANGVNLDLLGSREPEIYGSYDLTKLELDLKADLSKIVTLTGSKSANLEFFQSNDESKFLEKISEDWDGILMNPGAWTHTSLALADRLKATSTPYVEVHISNISNRESFRKNSFTSPAASGVVYGLGINSYRSGLVGLLSVLSLSKNP